MDHLPLVGVADIKKVIEDNHGLKWSPDYVFETYDDVLNFASFIEHHTNWHYELVSLEDDNLFGKHKLLISKSKITE